MQLKNFTCWESTKYDFNDVLLYSQDYCLDLFEPSGHGRRRKRSDENKSAVNDTQSAKFSENIEYTVLMPAGQKTTFK